MRAADESGSGSVLALAAVVVVLVAAVAVLGVGAALVTRARAAVAADAAALAAADAAQTDAAGACGHGGAVAVLNGARVTACRVQGPVVDVQVAVPAPLWLQWVGPARLNARAGPAETYREQLGRGDRAS